MVAPSGLSSFSDIVDIVQSIYTALSDSAGLSFEYTCLINELRSFGDDLRLVDSVLQTTPMSKSLRQDIEAETARCLKLLRKFWGRIERYKVDPSGRLSVIWRKVTWAIWKASEVKHFRQKLSNHESSIRLFLGG